MDPITTVFLGITRKHHITYFGQANPVEITLPKEETEDAKNSVIGIENLVVSSIKPTQLPFKIICVKSLE